MQFWNTMGMASLSGMVTGAGRGITSGAQLAMLGARIGIGQFAENQEHGDTLGLLNKAPSFPESSMDRLRNMMCNHSAEREEFGNEMGQKLKNMKDGFFESHSFESVMGQDGKPHVTLDQNGKPNLLAQPENPEARVAREEFENYNKTVLTEKQATEKETFLHDEKQQIQNFLQANRNDLGNPSIQGELQKMLLLTQKKGLKIQQDQEAEHMKIDLPTEDMKLFVDDETKKLREMEKKHQNVEDASQEARELIMYQEQVNEFIKDEKEKNQFAEKDEVFLKGPQAFLKPQEPPSLAKVLPPYLTEALYNMGIYSID
jgi:hypothetical protein